MDVERLITSLTRLEGTPFHHQGRNKFGVDCIGMLLMALDDQGIKPYASRDYDHTPEDGLLIKQIEESGLCYKRDVALRQRGDILIFLIRRHPIHLSVYLGDDRMIHAVLKYGVRIVPMSAMWLNRLHACYSWRI